MKGCALVSWSLYVKNGDLSVAGPGGYSLVSGPQKLEQDVRNWLLEERGTDPFHIEYGSTLDGGVLPDGTLVESSIGSNVTKERLLDIESEIRRVLYSYQQQQIDRLQRESTALGGKNTFAPGEILYSVDAVNVRQFNDLILAQITLRTQSGQTVTFVQPAS